MDWLMFELAAPLASYGGVAPGSMRDTDIVPSRSAILGILAAALGIERNDVAGQRELGRDVSIGTRVNAEAVLQRDYHTAQAPTQSAMKGRPCLTRRDELRVPKGDLNTVLSDRYYYANYAATIGIASKYEKLEALKQALRSPRFVLFLGRKSCVPAWPLDPHPVLAGTWKEALDLHDKRMESKLKEFQHFGVERWLRNDKKHYVYSGDTNIEFGDLPAHPRTISRRDEPIDTARRLFVDRRHWRLEGGGAP